MNQYQNRNQRPKHQQQNAISMINQEIKNNQQPLSHFFTKEDLYLPDHKAYKIADALQDLNVNQLRKIFDMIGKAAMLSKENKFDLALENLFMVVPMAAYATGRQLIKPKDFNDFIQLVITPNKIRSNEDIQTLFKLMQTILAYKKK